LNKKQNQGSVLAGVSFANIAPPNPIFSCLKKGMTEWKL